jgi:hypothetical protein
MKDTLQYYSEDGIYKKFNKYTLYHFGFVRNRITGLVLKNSHRGTYNVVSVFDDEGKQVQIRIARAIASTFIGPPPTLEHTADHKNKNRDDDTLDNIRWNDKSGQTRNQDRPETYKAAFIVVKDGVEKTASEWAEHLQNERNHLNHVYTEGMITKYAQKKQNGFAYKEYPDLPNETWKIIYGSKTTRGDYWKISDMNRVKFITKFAENVLSGERLRLTNCGYPKVQVGKCHILVFKSFFPDEYANKKPGEIILHEDDDKLDFRPSKLRLGTRRDNAIDAYNNGCYDGTETARTTCASYIKGVFEKEHISQEEAVRYLKSLGYDKSTHNNIGKALCGTLKTAYGRAWKAI